MPKMFGAHKDHVTCGQYLLKCILSFEKLLEGSIKFHKICEW